ncbi:MAG: VanZ family protein [Acidobacteriota bacterium]
MRQPNVPRFRLIAAVSWTLFVLVATLTPGDPSPGDGWFAALPDGTDKIVHVVLFAIETVLVTRWLGFRSIVLVIVASLAIGTEIAQVWIPYRGFEIGDLLADGLGCALGVVIGRVSMTREE